METSLKLIESTIVNNKDIIRDNVDSVIYTKKHYIDEDEPYKDYLNDIEESMKNIHRSKFRIENQEEKHNCFINNLRKENEAYIAKLPAIKESVLKEMNNIGDGYV